MKNYISSSTRVYLRFRDNIPESTVMQNAHEGFAKFGAEIVPYYWNDEIMSINDLGLDTMVCGYIDDIRLAMAKLDKPMPKPIDYPESLSEFLGRDIIETTLGNIRKTITSESAQVFIKPTEHKLFTGFIYDGSQISRRKIVSFDDDTVVFQSKVLPMISEYRCFVLDGEILDVRRYKGNWAVAPHRGDVEAAVETFEKSGTAPVSYALDFAFVPIDGGLHGANTLLVEANDCFALGHYGLLPEMHANCLAARWKQMAA